LKAIDSCCIQDKVAEDQIREILQAIPCLEGFLKLQLDVQQTLGFLPSHRILSRLGDRLHRFEQSALPILKTLFGFHLQFAAEEGGQNVQADVLHSE
jgi:hypothetical protein